MFMQGCASKPHGNTMHVPIFIWGMGTTMDMGIYTTRVPIAFVRMAITQAFTIGLRSRLAVRRPTENGTLGRRNQIESTQCTMPLKSRRQVPRLD